MSDTLITVMGLIIVAAINSYMTYRQNIKLALIKAGQEKTDDKLDAVHGEFNGMKDALVKQSGELGEQKGNKQGRIEEKAEQKERDDNI